MKIKIASLFFGLLTLIYSSAFSQQSSFQSNTVSNRLVPHNLHYWMVGIVLLFLSILAAYLFRIEKRVDKLEKEK